MFSLEELLPLDSLGLLVSFPIVGSPRREAALREVRVQENSAYSEPLAGIEVAKLLDEVAELGALDAGEVGSKTGSAQGLRDAVEEEIRRRRRRRRRNGRRQTIAKKGGR